MKDEAHISKQARRYTEEERCFFIREYRASGLALTKFCQQLGKPSYQIMRGWMTGGNDPTILQNLIDQSTLHGTSPNIQYYSKKAYIESLYLRLADLKVQLESIKGEIDSFGDSPN
ncbi:hypothetical protein [Pseudomonas putida]|uniref:hypothetical protein n=1 Tax=Pseudomonas putida TaxID=303 RepID=UPI0037350559